MTTLTIRLPDDTAERRAMAATGDVKQALAILDRLDAEDRQAGR